MLFFEKPQLDVTSVAPGDSAATDDDPYEKRITLARELEGVELKNPYKVAADPGHLFELKEEFRKQTDEMAGRHPDRRDEIALPEFSTMGEIFRAGAETDDLNHSFIGKGLSIQRAYDERIKTIKELTGKDLPNPVSQAYDPGQYFELRQEFDRQAAELAEQYPELRSRIVPLSPIERDAARLRAAAEHRDEDVWERSEKDASAWIARIGGGFYSFLHDPGQLTLSMAAPFGEAAAGAKGLLWMGLKQGAANAGLEAAMQPFVQQWRKEAGLDYGLRRAAFDIGTAGAFGAGLDIGVRSGIRGVRRAAGRPYLGEAEAAPAPSGQSSRARLPGATESAAPAATERSNVASPSQPPSPRGADAMSPLAALEDAARNAPEGSVLHKAANGDEEALRTLAKDLGPNADPAIHRALAEIEIEKLFPAPLDVDDGAHLESLARAIREQSGAPDLPVGDAIRPHPARPVAKIADESAGRALEIEGRKVDFRSVDPRQVTTDAATFQFKSGGNGSGVTERLRGVTRWDPVSAGKAIVFERADGQMVIADGHQRLGLAQRLEAQGEPAKLDAYIFREADGWTPEDVRAYAALKNMRESSGTSLDMAQVMRDGPDLVDGSLPLTDGKLREAVMLARLSPEAFDATVAGRLPPSFAALIGESVADTARHGGLLDEMAAADLANVQQARLYLKQLMELPTTIETQMTLFGEESFTRTVLAERAQVLDGALRTLKADKRIFGLLKDKARAIEAAGNVLARDANQARAENAAQLADLIEKLATSRGPVATILNDAAASVARGLDSKLASRAFVDRIADVLEREGLPGLVRTEEVPKPELAPVRIDDPIGPEAKAQTADINWALELNDEIRFALKPELTQEELSKAASWREPLQSLARASEDAGRLAPKLTGEAKALIEEIGAKAGEIRERIQARDYDGAEQFLRGIQATATRATELDNRNGLVTQWVRQAARALGGTGEAMLSLRGFYSPAIRAAESITQEKGTGEQFWKQITKVPGVKKDELDWMGLEEFLKDKKSVTKAEVLDFMRANQVQLDEKVFGAPGKTDRKGSLTSTTIDEIKRNIDNPNLEDESWPLEAKQVWSFGVYGDQFYIAKFANDDFMLINQHGESVAQASSLDEAQHMATGFAADANDNAPRFGAYKVPGGENYRELLIRLPELGETETRELTPEENANIAALRKRLDKTNVELTRAREARENTFDLREEINFISTQIRMIEQDAITQRPFISKHFQDQELVHLRVDDRTGLNGEKVLFINEVQSDLHQEGRRTGYGEISAEERAQMSREYDELRSNPWGEETQDRIQELRNLLSEREKRVPNAPFKGDLWLELALKRTLQYATENGYDAVSWARSDQIAKAVGAEPEKLALQYDQKIGKFLDKYTKKWGGKVEESSIDAKLREEGLTNEQRSALRSTQTYASASPGVTNPILRITPEMRDSIAEGQALFAKGSQQAAPSRNPTLRDTTLAVRAADAMASIRTEIDKAIAKSLPAGWRSEVRQRLVFGDLSEGLQKRNPGVPPSLEIEGTFDPYERIIYVSMAALDPVERAYEEAGHALKALRLIPDSDYAILTLRAKEIGARERFRIDERYGEVYGARWKDNPARLEQALEEEAIMQMVAARARGDSFGRTTNAIIDKLIKFLRAVRDMLGLKGFRTFEDVFEDVTEGGFARQMDEQAGGARAAGDIAQAPRTPSEIDNAFIARAEALRDALFATSDEGKGTPKEPGPAGSAKPTAEAAGAAEPQAPAASASASATAKTAGPQLPGGRESKRIRNLINQWAAEGKLTRKEADDFIQRFDMLESYYKDTGKAKQSIDRQISADAEERKRKAAIAEFKRRVIVHFLISFRDARGQPDPAKAGRGLIENIGQHELPQGFTDIAHLQKSIHGMAIAALEDAAAHFDKTFLTGQTRNKADLAKVVRELHGEKTGDALAAEIAASLSKVMEDLRLRFNAAGGNIPKRKDWHMPQSHDKLAMNRAKKDPWIDFILPLLDLKWMKHPLTGDPMPLAEVRNVLADIYDNLISDGWHEREASMGFRGLSAIANTRADPRSLIFKDADSWMKYSARFGAGDDAFDIIRAHILGMTKDIAAMEILGPNPRAMLDYIKQFIEQQAHLRKAGKAAYFPTRTEVTGRAFRAGGGWLARDPVDSYARGMNAQIENMWNVYTGAASAPQNAAGAAAGQTIRNLNVATKLGGAPVSALSDVSLQFVARKFAGLPQVKALRDIVAQIGKAGEREARRAGVIAENYMNVHNEAIREGAAWSATKFSRYLAERVMTISGLNAITRWGNHAMSMGIQAHLADMVGKGFADLDPRLQRMFRRWGLGATDWDAIRLDSSGRVHDVDFLSPVEIRKQLVENGGDPTIAERYLGMILGEAQYATLTGTIRGQAITYGSMKPGSLQRELWSMFMQFKSFSVNLAILQIERMAREFVSQGLWRGANYAVYALAVATLGGAFIEQLQQLRNGKDPRDMTSPYFWVTALYRSGGLSIWGDLLYSTENRLGGGVASTVAGPTIDTLNDLLNLTYGSAKKSLPFSDNKEKTNFGRQLSRMVSRYTPGSSIWYVRAAWERILMDNLQRMLDPEADASFQRKIQKAKQDYHQEFWWKPGGGTIPQRAPNPRAVLPHR